MPADAFCSYCLRPRTDTGPLVASPLATICRQCAAGAVKLIDAAPRQADLSGPSTPWDALTDDDLLSRLPDVAEAGEQVERHLRTWVDAARQRGLSWASIGEALGMTRQSAWERFTRPEPQEQSTLNVKPSKTSAPRQR